jgi:hypothetical protein
MGKTLIFEAPEAMPRRRDATEYRFPYRIVDSDLVGRPEEYARSDHRDITVAISGSLLGCWGLPDNILPKVLFEYGHRHLKQKILDDTLSSSEELFLHTGNTEKRCPFDAARIEKPAGATLVISDPVKPLMQDSSYLQLASRIIDTRDNINALFNEKYCEKLIVVREERDLLQLFRDAASKEEFFYRVCALANMATGLNVKKLRNLTGMKDTDKKSIYLLETYLTQNKLASAQIVKTLHAINNLRQGYPVHGDRSDGVLRAHEFFSLSYPVSDYNAAWKTLLLKYLDSLQTLLSELKKDHIG